MDLEPVNWSVVVRGAWNRAILTPQWVARNVFGLPENTPIQIEVPMDMHAPWRLKHNGVALVAGSPLLEAVAESPEYQTLDRARKYCLQAIRELPKTPFAAVGVNIRFAATETPEGVAHLVAARLDDVLADADCRIQSYYTRRTVDFRDGVINLEIGIGEGGQLDVVFNFHRASNDQGELESWLEIPMDELRQRVESLVERILNVEAQHV